MIQSEILTAKEIAEVLPYSNEKDLSPDQPRRRFWTVHDLAEYLQVPATWIYDRTRSEGIDRIPHFKMGKYLRFDPESPEFKLWMQQYFRQ